MNNEEWRDIPGWEGRFMVSSFGRVKNKRKGNIRIAGTAKNGYLRVNLYRDGKTTAHLVHRLVALAFIPNTETLKCVNHKDGNKRNNKVSNLEWITHQNNSLHAFRVLGRKSYKREGKTWFQKRGIPNPVSKPVIVRDKASGEIIGSFASTIEAGALLGMPQGCVSRLANGLRNHKNWIFELSQQSK